VIRVTVSETTLLAIRAAAAVEALRASVTICCWSLSSRSIRSSRARSRSSMASREASTCLVKVEQVLRLAGNVP
jgi:hypothetical protein